MQSAKERILFLLIAAVLVSSAARAQGGGKITGVIKDRTGLAITGAAVVVTNTQTGVKLSASTDQDGVFTFPVLSVGQYQIDVTSDAFKAYRKTDVVVDINSALILDVTLQVKEQD
jgi:Carboxypeptidase regulatory-like domain